MKRLLMPLALAITLFCPASHANGLVFGQGTLACEQWTEARGKAKNSGAPNMLIVSMQAWVTGFVTGANTIGFPVKKAQPVAMFSWMDNYCKSHPKEKLARASQYLLVEVQKKE